MSESILGKISSRFQSEPAYLQEPSAIRDIQQREGGEPCFRTAKSDTCNETCDWRRDCCRPVAEWLRYR